MKQSRRVERVVIFIMAIVAVLTVLYYNTAGAALPPVPEPSPLPHPVRMHNVQYLPIIGLAE